MNVAAVVIGRNEAERLRRCLDSCSGVDGMVVYVDSGSTDGSVAIARETSVDVVELDMSMTFSAARARNAGFARLQALSAADFIQFVDGDCEIQAEWINRASSYMAGHPDVAVLAGRLSERFPDASIYNRLGDLEWNCSKPGEVDAVGGIFMIRRAAFESVGGFNDSVTAGEEPELCQRLIQKGWKLVRLDCDMAWHDLAMNRFGQWWRRQMRTGYGGLDVARRFGLAGFIRNNWRARFWSVWPFLVLMTGVFAAVSGGAGSIVAVMSVAMLWPLQLGRIAWRSWRNGQPPDIAIAYGYFTMLSFWPQMFGQIKYALDRFIGRGPCLIEYKSSGVDR